jgi:hypothetical protein
MTRCREIAEPEREQTQTNKAFAGSSCTLGCRALQRPCWWWRRLTAVAAVASALPGTTERASSHLHPRAVLGCKGIDQPGARAHTPSCTMRPHMYSRTHPTLTRTHATTRSLAVVGGLKQPRMRRRTMYWCS